MATLFSLDGRAGLFVIVQLLEHVTRRSVMVNLSGVDRLSLDYGVAYAYFNTPISSESS